MARRRLPILCQKTRLCKFHISGRCTKGTACNFAHSLFGLRPLPELQCTKLCPTLLEQGECTDNWCTFAHLRDELRSFPRKPQRPRGAGGKPEPEALPLQLDKAISTTHAGRASSISTDVAERAPGREAAKESAEHGAPPARNKFRKTKLCMFFKEGRCKKSTSCNFAHTEEELKPLPDLSCTKLCATLLCTGRCDDAGCLFAHTPSELRSKSREQAQYEILDRYYSDKQQPGPKQIGSRSTSATSAAGVADVPPPADTDKLGAASLMELVRVKNTFVNFESMEDGEDVSHPAPRAGSAPPCVRKACDDLVTYQGVVPRDQTTSAGDGWGGDQRMLDFNRFCSAPAAETNPVGDARRSTCEETNFTKMARGQAVIATRSMNKSSDHQGPATRAGYGPLFVPPPAPAENPPWPQTLLATM